MIGTAPCVRARGTTMHGRMALSAVVLATIANRVAPALGGSTESPFVAAVVSYVPAPGQFVRDASLGDPTNALGAPTGLGTSEGNNSSVVTLGGFGGSLTLAFDHMVRDARLNPFGLDAIVFGNAFWRDYDQNRHWAECATIEISLDANGNGLADDWWYLIPGSHLLLPIPSRSVMTWDADASDPTYPPTNATWLPTGAHGRWTTQAFALPSGAFGASVVVNPAFEAGAEGILGYADYSPTLVLGDLDGDDEVDDPALTPEEFYTVPDNPFAVGITAGSGGGDAFDIAWAIDPADGEPADLPGFHFIRLTTAVAVVSPVFGEKSAEIDAVADVTIDRLGDFDGDEDIDLADLAGFQRCLLAETMMDESCHELAQERGVPTLGDWQLIVVRVTGPLGLESDDPR